MHNITTYVWAIVDNAAHLTEHGDGEDYTLGSDMPAWAWELVPEGDEGFARNALNIWLAERVAGARSGR